MYRAAVEFDLEEHHLSELIMATKRFSQKKSRIYGKLGEGREGNDLLMVMIVDRGDNRSPEFIVLQARRYFLVSIPSLSV